MKRFLAAISIVSVTSTLEFTHIPETRDPPSKRLYQSLKYSSDGQILVLFGGQLDNSNNFNDIWTFSLRTNQWKQMISSTQISPSKI